ncbi:MAG: NAD-dependent epimerase/dehydratase family protein, partial [Thermoleophilia bacterium]|nr:NAD-dependent epimerase/dehydratase family protein [Thermoleophilia bacterium]
SGERCVALDREADPHRLRAILGEERMGDVVLVAGDIVEEDLVTRVVAEQGVSRIVHLAALQIPFVAQDPARGSLVNVVGTLRVLEAARSAPAQVRGLVYASSAAVFGPGGRPATLYGVFKVANEESARIYAQDYGVASVGVRPWAIFGPGRDQGLTAAPTHAMKAAVLSRPYHIPFGGRVDLQYADDAARTFIELARLEVQGADVYNLRGSVVEVAEVVALIEEARPEAAGLITHGSDPIPIDAELDDSGLRGVLPEPPYTPLPDAIGETLAFFERENERGRLAVSEQA